MKSRAIILAAAVTAFAAISCNVQPSAEEIQAQKDKVDALNRSFQMRLRDVQDSLMAIDNSMDEKREAFSGIIEAEAPVFKEQLLDILKKNRRNEAGLYAYCNLENFVADESELEEPYAMLSKSVRDSYESFKDFTLYGTDRGRNGGADPFPFRLCGQGQIRTCGLLGKLVRSLLRRDP